MTIADESDATPPTDSSGRTTGLAEQNAGGVSDGEVPPGERMFQCATLGCNARLAGRERRFGPGGIYCPRWNGVLAPQPYDPVAQLSRDMAKALRGEYRTDNEGRRYRVNHSVTITRNGVQLALWGGSWTRRHVRTWSRRSPSAESRSSVTARS